MKTTLTLAACAAVLAIAAPAIAQPTSNANPAAPDTAPKTAAPAPAASPSTGTSADASATAGTPASITSGMSVKDNTGVLIGEITAVKPDASGQDLATIKMGADSFTVETTKLGLSGGVATINASQAQLKAMLPKK